MTKPNILFIHGCQFLDIKTIVQYIKEHPDVKVYVDNHSDLTNSASNWASKNILHKVIWKNYAKKIEPYTEKFYGVLPARVDFLIDMYNLPKNKVELLVMGADDDKVKEVKNKEISQIIRNEYSILKSDFLLVTGGKIDSSKKQIIDLMKAVNQLNFSDIKLLVFGSVDESLKDEFYLELNKTNSISFVGWLNTDETYAYFETANLIVFPGRHSVLWEQAVGQGKPVIVKYWEGTTHIDLGGNVRYIYNDGVEEIRAHIYELYTNKEKLDAMQQISSVKGMEKFSYREIAKISIT